MEKPKLIFGDGQEILLDESNFLDSPSYIHLPNITDEDLLLIMKQILFNSSHLHPLDYLEALLYGRVETEIENQICNNCRDRTRINEILKKKVDNNDKTREASTT